MSNDEYGPDDEATPLGVVVEAERGSLPFTLIHGEALVAAAVWSLGEAGVQPVDLDVAWDAVREVVAESGAPFVLHDCLCPMTPPDFIAACVQTARADDVVVVAVRPVTDTVKRVSGERLGSTVDRATLVDVCSPVVLPASVVAGLERLPSLDFAALASVLADVAEVRHVEAPPTARRVGSAEEIAVLEAMTGRQD